MIQTLGITQTGCRRLFPRQIRHKLTTLASLAVLVVFVQSFTTQALLAESTRSPNIILIMSDEK